MNLYDTLFEFQFLLRAHLYDETFVVLNKHFVEGLEDELLQLIGGIEGRDILFESLKVLHFQLLWTHPNIYIARIYFFVEHNLDRIEMLLQALLNLAMSKRLVLIDPFQWQLDLLLLDVVLNLIKFLR